MTADYRAVAPDFYEVLEKLVILKKTCDVVFRQDGSKAIITGKIVDLFEKDGARYMKMGSGLEIRLDQLLQVDRKFFPELC